MHARQHWGGVGAVLVFALALAAMLLVNGGGERVEEVTVEIIGGPSKAFDWSSDACARSHYSDLPVRAFRDYRGRTQLLLSTSRSRRMVGPSLDRLRVRCGVLLPSSLRRRVAEYNDREWLASLWTPNGREVVALVHEEYHPYQRVDRCPKGASFPCWYDAITFATSNDGGRSFRQPPAPRRVVASSPYPYDPRAGLSGYSSPSNIVRSPDDGYYYALFAAGAAGAQEIGSCLMRTRDPRRPGSWRAWDGEGFTVEFADAYRPPAERPEEHVCELVAPEQLFRMRESLTYNTYLDRFLLVGLKSERDPTSEDQVPGIYFSLSEDLIQWSEPELIMEGDFARPAWLCGEPDPIAYPSLLDPRSRSRNFSTTGRRPYLFYARVHYRHCLRTPNRDLLRVRLEVSR